MEDNVLVIRNAEMLVVLDEFLEKGIEVQLRVKGNSMLPFLRDGKEIVVLSKPILEELVIGAIVLFRYEEGFVLHRIIRKNGDFLTIMGDYVLQSEAEVVLSGMVIGVVRKIISPGGKTVTTNSLQWRLISHFWIFIRPLLRKLFVLLKRVKQHLRIGFLF